jgi:II/X family phage/plasmid replication protein
MIDKLVLQIPFSRHWVTGRADSSDYWDLPDPWSRKGIFAVDLRKLPFKRAASDLDVTVNPDGTFEYEDLDLYCPWESIPSSHGGMAMKVYDQGNSFQNWPYIEIKCSPAKLVQGHNVWGWDDLGLAADNMLTLLHSRYPWLFGGFLDRRSGHGVVIDTDAIRVAEIDITYSVSVPNPRHRSAFISLLHTLSKGQTKARGDSYQTTAYFGAKKSKVKKIKVYLKAPEIDNDNADRKRKKQQPIPAHIAKKAADLVRVEATIKREWLERRGHITELKRLLSYIRGTDNWYRMVFAEATKDLWDALKGQEVKVMSDDSVMSAIAKVHSGTRGKPARVFGFYQSLRAVGYDQLKEQYPRQTFTRLVSELQAAGFARATLQSLHKSTGATIIQLPTIISLDALGEPRPKDEKPIRLRDVA